MRTKIVCTIGPASESPEMLRRLIEAGMSVARLNTSHGTKEELKRRVLAIRKAREATGRPVAILLDTRGPEIRVGQMPDGGLPIQEGQTVRFGKGGYLLSPESVLGQLKPKTRVLFDDGYLIADVVASSSANLEVKFRNSGLLKTGKKMNVPGVTLDLPALTEHDLEDLHLACEMGVEYVAASFVRQEEDILAIRKILEKQGQREIQIIAKIETHEGVENFDSIVRVSDAIMIARGDLGVELDLARVPKLQKQMIRSCFRACKPSITATQMLESMIQNPRPTRAEASDVANAIYDSSSAVMLSAESAVGKYPLEAVQQMREIVEVAEADINYLRFFEDEAKTAQQDLSSAVALAAVQTAYAAKAKAIFALTASGYTARLVSRFRPSLPILAPTPHLLHYHQMALNWGVIPIHLASMRDAREAFDATASFALKHGFLKKGDIVVVTAGIPFGQKGSTNTMMVETI